MKSIARVCFKGLGICGALVVALPGTVFAEGEVCSSSSDCTSGEFCAVPPCAGVACAPGESCEPEPDCPTEGICTASSTTLTNDSCEADADCGAGFVCTVFDTEACNRIGCVGDDCPPPICSPIQIRSCAPAPCETDSDCTDDLVCLEISYGSCSGGAGCPPNEPCVPEPPVCTDHIERYCGPKHAAPCTVDADCGEGFECLEASAPDCVCVSNPDGTSEPCDCGEPQGSGTFYCSLIEVDCASADDCPTDWTCEEQPVGVPLICRETPDGGCEELPVPPPRNLCMPSSVGQGWGRAGGVDVPALPLSGGGEDLSNSTPPEVTGRASADVTDADLGDPGSCSASSSDAKPLAPLAFLAFALLARGGRRRSRR